MNERAAMVPQPGNQLYHVTESGNVPSILRDGLKARAGSWLKVTWRPRVFFATTQIAAYEIAQMFAWERKGNYAFVLVDPTKIRGKLRPDRDYDKGLWVAADVPPEAIVGVNDVDEEFFESDEFLTYVGCDEDDELA